jgi:dTDP-4-amino-4,6-dideoxygalactose transaminase
MPCKIPFHKACIPQTTIGAIEDVLKSRRLESGGAYIQKCEKKIAELLETKHVVLYSSCTTALEAACEIAGLSPGDEVILPAYTFVSSANAIVRAGATPVFADIDKENLCIDLNQVERLITSKTKAIMPVHYAGFSCDMDNLISLAKKHNLIIIEDAAQAFLADYKSTPLGTIGDFGCFSFHNTKTFSAGEGGLLVCKTKEHYEQALVWRDKGTNRQDFLDGKVDKYGWISKGTNAGLPELSATVLYGHIAHRDEILEKRKKLFERYTEYFSQKNDINSYTPLFQPDWNDRINYHFYYLLFKDKKACIKFSNHLASHDIQTAQHYPSLAASQYAANNNLSQDKFFPVSQTVAEGILRLPLYTDMTESEQDYVFKIIAGYQP